MRARSREGEVQTSQMGEHVAAQVGDHPLAERRDEIVARRRCKGDDEDHAAHRQEIGVDGAGCGFL